MGEEKNILELEHLPLDPILTGFSGVIIELCENEGVFTLMEIAIISGNRIFRFSSQDEALVRRIFAGEVASYRVLQKRCFQPNRRIP